MKNNVNTRKPLRASSYFKKWIIGIICFGIFMIGVLFTMQSQKILTISHQETGEIFYQGRVEVGDIVTYEWIHSFEHIPWFEYYHVSKENHLILDQIRVAGFGAGIPENKGIVTVENGMVVMREINEDFDHIQWLNSHTALQYIAINDVEIIHGDQMPHHEPLKLEIKGRLTQWLSQLMP